MQRLIVKNVGPIKEVDVSLKRYNFFIGPQSSGKSTIAKIVSTCRWIEKETVTSGNVSAFAEEADFLKCFTSFHKMHGYFGDDSEIHFTSDFVRIDYKDHVPCISLDDRYAYRRQKICYIPSERNAVALPELQGLEFGDTNLRSFLFDWFKARESFVESNKADILDLGVKYFYVPAAIKNKDMIQHCNGQTYQIPLSDASSGLQSVVPLKIMLQFYTGQYFETYKEKLSYDADAKSRQMKLDLMTEMVMKALFPEFDSANAMAFLEDLTNRINHADPVSLELMTRYSDVYNNLAVPDRTSFIVEEPEQNLFPDTQTDLLDFMISVCGDRHELTLTTHSPYLLNQLNLLFKRFDEKDGNYVGLDFDKVSVYAVGNGKLVDLKLGNAHLVNPEYLSEPLDRIYNKYEAYGKR